MSEYDKSRKIASETLEKGKAAAEQTARSVEQSYSVTIDNIRYFNVKMIDMAHHFIFSVASRIDWGGALFIFDARTVDRGAYLAAFRVLEPTRSRRKTDHFPGEP